MSYDGLLLHGNKQPHGSYQSVSRKHKITSTGGPERERETHTETEREHLDIDLMLETLRVCIDKNQLDLSDPEVFV